MAPPEVFRSAGVSLKLAELESETASASSSPIGLEMTKRCDLVEGGREGGVEGRRVECASRGGGDIVLLYLGMYEVDAAVLF